MIKENKYKSEDEFWDSLEDDQLRHWMKLGLDEKIRWLEEAERLVRRFHPNIKGPLSSHTLLIRPGNDLK